jgi:hypothetical protein
LFEITNLLIPGAERLPLLVLPAARPPAHSAGRPPRGDFRRSSP